MTGVGAHAGLPGDLESARAGLPGDRRGARGAPWWPREYAWRARFRFRRAAPTLAQGAPLGGAGDQSLEGRHYRTPPPPASQPRPLPTHTTPPMKHLLVQRKAAAENRFVLREDEVLAEK